MQTFALGSIVETKKAHPCGSKAWKVIRTGADFKLKCEGCGRIIMLPYQEMTKKVKRVLMDGAN